MTSMMAPPPIKRRHSDISIASVEHDEYPTGVAREHPANGLDHAGPDPGPSNGTYREVGSNDPETPAAATDRTPSRKLRTAIACSQCRRSKVKCYNDGSDSACRACKNSGRECVYPAPASGSRRREERSARNSSTSREVTDGESRRQRPRLSNAGTATASSSTSAAIATALTHDNPLDGAVLTSTIWRELFEIFQNSFAMDLPFIHPPTFIQPLQESSLTQRPRAADVVLLAFLALTARHHTGLCRRLSTSRGLGSGSPIELSEYYARMAESALSSWWDSGAESSSDIVQAQLILGLYDWSQCRGTRAWHRLGLAFRACRLMGFPEIDGPPIPFNVYYMQDTGARSNGSTEHESYLDHSSTYQESKRRTFWAYFNLERLMSCGNHRTSLLDSSIDSLRLPMNDTSFQFGESCYSLRLSDLANPRDRIVDMARDKLTVHERQLVKLNISKFEDLEARGMACVYIEFSKLYGEILAVACQGNDGQSKEFYPLLRKLDSHRSKLPHQHRFSMPNLFAHATLQTLGPFAQIRAMATLCQVLLDRPRLRFLPRADAGGGDDARAYNAETIGAVDNFAQVLRTAQEWHCVLDSPMSGFATYLLVLIRLHWIYFPWSVQVCDRWLFEHWIEDIRFGMRDLERRAEANLMASGWFCTLVAFHDTLYDLQQRCVVLRHMGRDTIGYDPEYPEVLKPAVHTDICNILGRIMDGIAKAHMGIADVHHDARVSPAARNGPTHHQLPSISTAAVAHAHGQFRAFPEVDAPLASTPQRANLPDLDLGQSRLAPACARIPTRSPSGEPFGRQHEEFNDEEEMDKVQLFVETLSFDPSDFVVFAEGVDIATWTERSMESMESMKSSCKGRQIDWLTLVWQRGDRDWMTMMAACGEDKEEDDEEEEEEEDDG